VGAERTVPTALFICQSTQSHGQVLSIVYRAIATHLIHKAGYTKSTAQTGAVTLIQRFGSAGKAKIAICRRQEAVLACREARAVNLNIHFHMIFLDGVDIDSADRSRARFRWVKAPTNDELTQLTHTIAQRVARYLERQGLLVCDAENGYLTAEGVDADSESPLHQLLGSSITRDGFAFLLRPCGSCVRRLGPAHGVPWAP
jgi:hypothetical protein